MQYNAAMEVIYIDSLFLLNLLIDYLLCLVSARVCGLWLRRGRYVLAAFIGAAYSVAAVLPGLGFLSARWAKLGCATLMGFAAYGRERQRIKCTAVFLAVSAAFGGAVWAVSMAGGMSWDGKSYVPIPAKSLILAFTLCNAGIDLLFRARGKLPERPRVPVRLRFLGKETELMALLDSGNTLTDPISGAEVMIVSPHVLRPMLGDIAELFDGRDSVELLEALDALPELKGKFRLIPYSAVGTQGLLPVFRPESVEIDGRGKDGLLAAVSPSAAGDGFDGIL